MNKVLIIGRLTRDPEINETTSGIKYARFTIAVTRQFGDNPQADFIPIVAWRNSADFVSNYLIKGSLVSVEGRFTSSTFKNSDGQNITRYEVAADRVEGLETKEQREKRILNTNNNDISFSQNSNNASSEIKFAKESIEKEKLNSSEDEKNDVPWELEF